MSALRLRRSSDCHRWSSVPWLVATILMLAILATYAGTPQGQPPRQEGFTAIRVEQQDGTSAKYMSISDGRIEVTIRIVVREDREMAFTVFLDGEQIVPQWDDNFQPVWQTTVKADGDFRIGLKVAGIDPGIHNLHIMYAAEPRRTEWDDQGDLLDASYSPEIVSLTVASAGIADCSAETPGESPPDTARQAQTTSAQGFPATEGFLSVAPEWPVVDPSFDIRDRSEVWYLWSNHRTKPTSVRLAVLVDWIQIPWPNLGPHLLSRSVPPHGEICQPIDLTQMPIARPSHVVAVLFVNEDTQRHYVNALGEIAIQPDGVQVYCSNRMVVYGLRGGRQ